MSKYIKREDAVFSTCKALDKFGGCKMGALCPDFGCSEVRDIIDTFPMIEIPDQHGRLGDLDKLNEEMRLFIKENMLSRDDARELLEIIADTPTIITASEEGKT